MGSGTIYKRGNSWCVGFTMKGRRYRETVGPNKKVAEKVLSLRMTQVLETVISLLIALSVACHLMNSLRCTWSVRARC